MTDGAQVGAGGGADLVALIGGEARRAELTRRLAVVRERMDAAAREAGRDPASLTLIAVSKTYPAEDAVIFGTLGVGHFAENREQEATSKVTLVTQWLGVAPQGSGGGSLGPPVGPAVGLGLPPGPEWHFVGQLQRNKARSVLSWANWVQSVDRPGLVPVLSRLAVERGWPLEVCLQVSLDDSSSDGGLAAPGVAGSGRGGIGPGGVAALADLVEEAPGLTLRGVMAVAPRGELPQPAFAKLRAVAERLLVDHPGATVISAGMSSDLESAVAEGATHLRIGTALFGERPGVP